MSRSYLLTGLNEDTYLLFKTICSFNNITVKASLLKYIDFIVGDFDYSEMVRKTNSVNLIKKEE